MMTKNNVKPKISIIIPYYNNQKTIRRCLESISSLKPKPIEVNIVDDNSKNPLDDMVKKYDCKILKLNQHYGSSYARTYGAEKSKGDLLVFVDSDILLPPNALELILSSFKENPKISCVTGILSPKSYSNNLVTDYKNLFMHYMVSKFPKFPSTTNGMITAIKKSVFQKVGGYNENFKAVEDVEFGNRLHESGYLIYLNKKLRVKHLSEYSLKTLLKSDFKKAFFWSRIILRNFKDFLNQLSIKGKYTDKSIGFMINAYSNLLFLIFFAMVIFEPSAIIISAFFLAISFLLNAKFWFFLKKKKGTKFAATFIPLTILDMAIIALGALAGTVVYFLSEIKEYCTNYHV